jgi:formamidopyrimidine-DNA glycosylase
MPELPDITVYVEKVAELTRGEPLLKVRLASPFWLRSFDPPLGDAFGKSVVGVERLGKRVVISLEAELRLVLHLMIAGRFKWLPSGAPVPKKTGLGALDFPTGSLIVTEASSKKRASLHVVRGPEALRQFDRGGVEPLEATFAGFAAAIKKENRTLKRILTDPTLVSGIGNAYSDEILHRAQLSPIRRSHALSEEELQRLFDATRATLVEWTQRLRVEAASAFPTKVTAFRKDFSVHGKYGQPCPVCNTVVQRIRYAENELNYCPRCQTDGKVLADRGLSRLLKDDWPRTIEELEERPQPIVAKPKRR